MLSKIDLGIEHLLIKVINRSHFRMTHVPKVDAGFRHCVSLASKLQLEPNITLLLAQNQHIILKASPPHTLCSWAHFEGERVWTAFALLVF